MINVSCLAFMKVPPSRNVMSKSSKKKCKASMIFFLFLTMSALMLLRVVSISQKLPRKKFDIVSLQEPATPSVDEGKKHYYTWQWSLQQKYLQRISSPQDWSFFVKENLMKWGSNPTLADSIAASNSLASQSWRRMCSLLKRRKVQPCCEQFLKLDQRVTISIEFRTESPALACFTCVYGPSVALSKRFGGAVQISNLSHWEHCGKIAKNLPTAEFASKSQIPGNPVLITDFVVFQALISTQTRGIRPFSTPVRNVGILLSHYSSAALDQLVQSTAKALRLLLPNENIEVHALTPEVSHSLLDENLAFRFRSQDALIISATPQYLSYLCDAGSSSGADLSIFLLPPPLLTQYERDKVEALIRSCSSKSVVYLFWYRPPEDTTWLVPSGVQQRPLPQKDIAELSLQFALHITTASHPYHPIALKQSFVEATFPRLATRFEVRNMYDPDHFVLNANLETVSWRVERNVVESSQQSSVSIMRQEFGRGTLRIAIRISGRTEEVLDVHKLLLDFHSSSTSRPTEPAALKRSRKLNHLLGDIQRVRFGWHTENRKSLTDIAVYTNEDLHFSHCAVWLDGYWGPSGNVSGYSLFENDVVFFHYPWVLDNLYHVHNDNVFPLLLALHLTGTLERTVGRRVLVLLPSSRGKQPLLVFRTVMSLYFDHIVHLESLLQNGSLCAQRGTQLVWGRPPRPFAMEPQAVQSYLTHNVIPEHRKRIWNAFASQAAEEISNATKSTPLRVTWISRKGERAMFSDGALLGVIAMSSPIEAFDNIEVSLRLCCDGLTYEQQVQLMRTTDILIGVHGAGLFHVTNMDPQPRPVPGATKLFFPLVVHLGSLFLNYHEQTIIERLVFLSNAGESQLNGGIRFWSTVTKPNKQGGTWRSEFAIAEDELLHIWEQTLWRYFNT